MGEIIFANISAKNFKELEEKYKGVDIEGLIEKKVKYYRMKPFKERRKLVWIDKIKEFLELINEDFKEEVKEDKNYSNKEEELSGDYIGFGQFGAYVKVDFVVEDILKIYSFKTIYGKRGEDVWCYNKQEGIWEMNGREVIKTQTEKMLGVMSKIKPVNEIFEKIKRMTAISGEEFDKIPEEIICLTNGVLNVKTQELLPFNPNYNFKTKLNLTYNKKTDCPKIKKFLQETFYPEDILVIQEWFGFHLLKRYFIKKALIVFGEKDTGKTIFLNLLTKFIGEKNKAGISLHLITKNDKFTLSFLKDKLANIYDDLSFSDLNDAGGFKIACGGGYISAEYKFGDSFEFLNYAKNTFATNKIPVLDTEPDNAYYLRWLPIPCDNEVPKEEQDRFLIDKLTTTEELSGLLNYALEGLSRLLEKESFSFNKTTEEIKILMEKHSNHFVAFVQDCLIKSEGEKITKEEMFQFYKAYAEKNNLLKCSKNQLGRGLEKHCPFIKAKIQTNSRYWEGAGINPKNLCNNIQNFLETTNNAKNTTDTTLLNLPLHITKGIKIKDEVNLKTPLYTLNGFSGSVVSVVDEKIEEMPNKINKSLADFSDEDIKKTGFSRKEYAELVDENEPKKVLEDEEKEIDKNIEDLENFDEQQKEDFRKGNIIEIE